MLFVLLVRAALWMGLTRARDLIIDSAPILAWRRADLDAAVGHAPAHHPRPLLRGYRVHTLLCRASGLPLLFRLSPANVHDAPLCSSTAGTGHPSVRASAARDPPGCGLLGPQADRVDPHGAGRPRRDPLEREAPEAPGWPAAHLDRRGAGQAHQYRAVLWAGL